MRLIGLRLPILAVLALAPGWVPARAQVLYMETADWMPTASLLAVPTSYVVASSYAVPTSYTIPTVYATAYVTQSAMFEPTTYLGPTYYETRFRRRGLFGRRLVETTRAYYLPTTAYYPTTYYYPTTFYSPTVLDTAVVSTGYTTTGSSDCCGGTMIAANTSQVRTYPSEQASAAASTSLAPRNTPRPKSAPLQSQAAEDDAFDSNVPALPAREQGSRSETSGEVAGQAESPPTPPVPVRQQSTAPPAGSSATQTKPGAPATGTGAAQPKNVTPRVAPAAPTTPGGVELPQRQRAWKISRKLPPAMSRPARVPADGGSLKSPLTRAHAFSDPSIATSSSAGSRLVTPTSRRKACGSPS